MTLTKNARDAIGRTVGQLRALVEEEFVRLASGRFGLHINRRVASQTDEQLPKQLAGHVEPLESLSLTPSQRRERDELIGALVYLVEEGCDGNEAVARLIREATFTAVNRLLAIRVAEAVGALPAALSQGRQSSGYRDVVRDLFPLLTQDEDEGFWTYLQICGDELGASVPLLFDRRLPVSAFVPSRTALDNAVAVINDAPVRHVWSEPETLGWAYQFFNSDEERQSMRKAQAPRNPRELAVRNQFFTPRYVVDWLVQNTLGRRLRQADYKVDLPLLVGEVGDHRSLALEDVRVLDPAVGSGHFLLGCYDLLEQAWHTVGVTPADAAPRIMGSLYGIEIDPRAAQVAQAVLLLRARRAAPGAPLPPPVIVTARGLPSGKGIRNQVFAELGPSASELALDIADALEQASELGSLLKVERRLQEGVTSQVTGAQPRLGDHTDATVEELEEQILAALRRVAAHADASPILRMFAADAADAIRFVEICQQRYDTVLMNPPFGDPIPSTHEYLRAAYGRSAVDVYAAFVERGIDLLRNGGYVGAITSRSGFFLTTFTEWRSETILPRLQGLLDLGLGVMHDAMVEAAAYVLQARPHHGQAVFRRLLDAKDKAARTYAPPGREVFLRRPEDFTHIPGAPAAYWLTPAMLDVFKNHASIADTGLIDVRQGLATADDFRFVRLWWEVPANCLGRGRRWLPFAKGGNYAPYYSDLHLVVDWERDGQRLRNFGQSVIRNPNAYFRPGLTWSLRSQKGFSVRPVPANSIFGHKGPMVFVRHDDPERLDELMAYLNSSLAATLLETMVAFGSYEVGAVQRLPHITVGSDPAHVAQTLTALRQREAQRDEVDHLFVSPWVSLEPVRADLAELSREVDNGAIVAIGDPSHVTPLSATYPTQWFESDYVRAEEPDPEDEVSYLLGAALGRWDVRIAAGTVIPPPVPNPYDPLSASARGALIDASGLPAERPPGHYPLNVPPDRILHDDPTHPADVVRAIEAAAEVIMNGPSATGDLLYRRRIRDLRAYLRDKFFSAHIKRYSASRRYAPVYWHLAVASRAWGLWVYAPSLSRETLFAVASAARDKLRRINEQAQQLRNQAGRELERSVRERIETLEELASEVDDFAEAADSVAQSGWEPDLNDGFVLCAAPLEELFIDRAWQQEIARHRKKLERGEYPWATVQRTYFPSRP